MYILGPAYNGQSDAQTSGHSSRVFVVTELFNSVANQPDNKLFARCGRLLVV